MPCPSPWGSVSLSRPHPPHLPSGRSSQSAETVRACHQWTVDYAENMCVVSRQFHSGDQKVTLGFRPIVMSDNFRVALFVPDAAKEVTRGTAKLGFDSLPPVEAPFVKGPVKIEGTHLIGVDTKVQGHRAGFGQDASRYDG